MKYRIFASALLGGIIGISIITVNQHIGGLHAAMVGIIGFGALAVINYK